MSQLPRDLATAPQLVRSLDRGPPLDNLSARAHASTSIVLQPGWSKSARDGMARATHAALEIRPGLISATWLVFETAFSNLSLVLVACLFEQRVFGVLLAIDS